MNSPWFWTQAYIIARQKFNFWNVCIWILLSSPLSTPTQDREIWWAALAEMNRSLLSTIFPDVCVGSCRHHPFWALLKRMCPESLLGIQNRSAFEELYVLPKGQFFICNPKDLNFLTEFYFFSLLWTAVITSAQGSRKSRVLLVSAIFIYFHFNFLPD